MNQRFASVSSQADWTEKIKALKEQKTQQARLWGIFTEAERILTSEDLTRARDNIAPEVINAVANKFITVRDQVMAAQANVDNERRKITASWDPVRLGNEIVVMEKRVEHATRNGNPNIAQIQDIFNESMESNDKYKSRAAAEVFQSIVEKIPQNAQTPWGGDMRMVANSLASSAKNALEELKITPALVAAVDAKNLKADELTQVRRELFDAADVLGYVRNEELQYQPLENVLNSIQVDDAGNFQIKE